MRDPKITELEIVVYEYTQHNLGTDYNGFNLVYEGIELVDGCVIFAFIQGVYNVFQFGRKAVFDSSL